MKFFTLLFFLVCGFSLSADFTLSCKGPGKSECDNVQLAYKDKAWLKDSVQAEPEDSPNDYVMLMWNNKEGTETFHFTIAKGVIKASPSKKFEATLSGVTCKSTLTCEKKR